MKNQIKQPNSITLNMSGAQWAEINRLCSQLNINPYDYAKTTSKKAGLLIYALTKCCVCGDNQISNTKARGLYRGEKMKNIRFEEVIGLFFAVAIIIWKGWRL